MRYPSKRPRQCTTIDYPGKGVYCSTTQQYIGGGVCGLCYDHYNNLASLTASVKKEAKEK